MGGEERDSGRTVTSQRREDAVQLSARGLLPFLLLLGLAASGRLPALPLLLSQRQRCRQDAGARVSPAGAAQPALGS
jgi:hypothetical protein